MESKSHWGICRKHRMKKIWVCIHKDCTSIFCQKCRRKHSKDHFSQMYSIRDLMEEELEPFESNQLTEHDKESIKLTINEELEATRRRFENDLEDIKDFFYKKLENSGSNQSNNNNNNKEILNLRKNLEKKADPNKLILLAEKYHDMLQESHVAGTLKQSFVETLEDEIENTVKQYNDDLTKAIEKILDENYGEDIENNSFAKESPIYNKPRKSKDNTAFKNDRDHWKPRNKSIFLCFNF